MWPFHCGDPRNAEDKRPRGRYGQVPVFPYGDSYVLKLLKEGLPPEEVIARYLKVDVAEEVDLDKLLRSALTLTERQDRTGAVKIADYVASNFRTKSLFQTVNHANNRLLLYMTNRMLEVLDCAPVPETELNRVTETVERPMPVHPSIARHFGIGYIDDNSRYPVDEVRNLTFAEYIRDYVYYANGIINYWDNLINDPLVPVPAATAPSTEEIDKMGVSQTAATAAKPQVVAKETKIEEFPDLTGRAFPASAEEVAYILFRHIASVERQALDPFNKVEPQQAVPSRKWILDTYAQCLEVVRGG